MKLVTKMSLAIGGMVILVLIGSGVGYYGVQRLAGALEFLSEKAWKASNGFMETTISVQDQLIGLQRALNDQHADDSDDASLRKVIRQTDQALGSAVADMRASGLFTDEQTDELNQRVERFGVVRDRLIETYTPFLSAHRKAMADLDDFKLFLDLVEQVGDGELDGLARTPDRQLSWNSGLKDRWLAADYAMESRIALLEYIEHYQRLISFQGEPQAMLGEMGAWDLMFQQSVGEAIQLAAYDREVPAYLGDSGTFSDVLERLLSQHREDFTHAVNQFIPYREARLEYRAEAESFLTFIRQVQTLGDAKVAESTAGLHGLKRTVIMLVIASLLLSVGIACGIGWWVARHVVRPVAMSTEAMGRIATGDLRHRLNVTGNDEIGQMAAAFNGFSSQLSSTIQEVKERAGSISGATLEVTQGNNDLSQRTETQAAALEETASSMEQMTANVRQAADNAAKANQLAYQVRTQAERGGEVVADTVSAMGEIEEASKKIADIIGMVGEIAFQTNLLALNASVEAARAGEQGRGFAVVATEVRNLAQRSAAAASDIRALIDNTVEKVGVGSKLVEASGKALTEIVAGVSQVSDMVDEIDAASQEQARGIEQVNTAILQMDEMTQQNAALVEQTAATSDALAEQAIQLAGMMDVFNVGSDTETAPNQTASKPSSSVSTPDERPGPSDPVAASPPAKQSRHPLDDEDWDF